MILAILQARVSSRRLPGKVLKPILGKPMLLRQIERIQCSKRIDKLVVATSEEATDDKVEEICLENKIECFRGSLLDVLDRFYQAAQYYIPDHIVRLTGDCPLLDPEIIDLIIETHLSGNFDYTSNTIRPTFPDGLDVEILTYPLLKEIWKEAVLPSDREHVTSYITENKSKYKVKNVINERDLSNLRWTVDEDVDFELVNKIYEELFNEKQQFSFQDTVQLVEKNPTLKSYNIGIYKNVNSNFSSTKEQSNKIENVSTEFQGRYRKSHELLSRALNTIPLGTQTFSKSITHFPLGVSPYFIEKGKGSTVWDVDGNEYIDFINSLATITLGYNDPDVNKAVNKQLEKGTLFSLAHPLEIQVAEKIKEMVPCAEMVRFGKNGSDATAGAIRLARAYTGRDHVAVCGYHGWQDWYIGTTTRSKGVPNAIKEFTHPFTYNNLNSLEAIFNKYPNQIAAVILEPMNVEEPEENFLEKVKAITKHYGAILIFDEMITGFRFANGGAQEFFGVTPDLATFGKGIANGYPLSAVVGRKDIMNLFEEVFFSFTFGGETLSLAASLATLQKLQNKPVIQTIRNRGLDLKKRVLKLIKDINLEHMITVKGNPVWSFILFNNLNRYSEWEIKTLFLQEVFKRGILTLGTHNMSYSHTKEDINQLIKVYEEVFLILKVAIQQEKLYEFLETKPIEPLFKIR